MANVTCSIQDCGEPIEARGWCSKHYGRWRAHGDPLVTFFVLTRGDQVTRFWAKVDRRSDGECWPWLGATDEKGYGLFGVSSGTCVRAHRFAYELMVGPIPQGMTIDHVKAWGCIRQDCMNALTHMEPVSALENLHRTRKTHCSKGHELTATNVYYHKNGGRTCRTCTIERTARRKRRLREASV